MPESPFRLAVEVALADPGDPCNLWPYCIRCHSCGATDCQPWKSGEVCCDGQPQLAVMPADWE